ncbi:MAG: hypothetical protein LBD68_04555 [Zoogloeaceae bacterium]|jgi:hypothetical protein|nr:hypothetical protein [Zoogloeaceae bacterium]
MRIYAADLAEFRAMNRYFCARGCRAWARAHGFSWAEFVREGVEEKALLATEDALALAIVRWKREREK